MNDYVESAIALVEKEQSEATAFAIAVFDALDQQEVEPSVEVDGKFYISTEAVSLIAKAAAESAITLSIVEPTGKAASAAGRISQVLDALVRQAKGIPQRDVRKAAEDLGL